MSYKYKRPNGTLHKVSIRKWNKTFANRGRWPFIVAEVYLEDDSATVQFVIGKVGKISAWLLTPMFYIYGTLAQGFPETHGEVKRVLFDKEYGAFSSDRVYKNANNKGWDKLMSLLKQRVL